LEPLSRLHHDLSPGQPVVSLRASNTGCYAMTATFDELASEVAHLVHREVGTHDIHQVWTEDHRIRFRERDGRTGDVEVLVNWDVVAGRVEAITGEGGNGPGDLVQ
jgi:hypothetical protein